MSRFRILLVTAGGLAVLALLVALWQMTRVEDAPALGSTPPPERAAPVAATPAAPIAPPSAPTAPARATPAGPAPVLPADPGGGTSPPASDGPAPATRENTKNLHFGATQMHEQVAAVEPQVRACIERAAAAGARPTGTATLTYIVVQKRDRIVIEDTGVVEDKTTLPDESLVECLRETSRAMKFEGLPREAEGVVVTRAVVVADGNLTENKHVTFSYLR